MPHLMLPSPRPRPPCPQTFESSSPPPPSAPPAGRSTSPSPAAARGMSRSSTTLTHSPHTHVNARTQRREPLHGVVERRRHLQRLGLRLRRLHHLRLTRAADTNRRVLVQNRPESRQHLIAQPISHSLSPFPRQPEIDQNRVLRVLQLLRLSALARPHSQQTLQQHAHQQHAEEVHGGRRPLAQLRLHLPLTPCFRPHVFAHAREDLREDGRVLRVEEVAVERVLRQRQVHHQPLRLTPAAHAHQQAAPAHHRVHVRVVALRLTS